MNSFFRPLLSLAAMLCLTITLYANEYADQQGDKAAEQRRLDYNREEQKIQDNKIEEQRLDQQREDRQAIDRQLEQKRQDQKRLDNARQQKRIDASFLAANQDHSPQEPQNPAAGQCPGGQCQLPTQNCPGGQCRLPTQNCQGGQCQSPTLNCQDKQALTQVEAEQRCQEEEHRRRVQAVELWEKNHPRD